MLNFSTYAKTLLEATEETKEVFINELIWLITNAHKQEVVNKKYREQDHYADTGTVSKLLQSNRNLKKEILAIAKTYEVINSIEDNIKKYIIPELVKTMIPDVISNLDKIIYYDTTISETKRMELRLLAKESLTDENKLAEFLAGTFLYAIYKPNDTGVIERMTENHNLPIGRNEYFTGRADHFENIRQLFKYKKNNTIHICQTIVGLGGVGKTQLAIEYAYRNHMDFKSCIWFVNAEKEETAYASFVEFANHFGLTKEQNIDPEKLRQGVKGWLERNKKWLLIFDNLEYDDTIRPYLPEKFNGRIIITTRSTRIERGIPIILDVFEKDEALRFLKRRLSKDEELNLELYKYSTNTFDIESKPLLERLGFFPLALEQAAAYIRKTKCALTTYLELLVESALSAFDEKYAIPEYYEKVVTSTWKIAIESIRIEGAEQLFDLCAYMAPDKIPVSLFVNTRENLPSPLKEDLAKTNTRLNIVTELRTYSLTDGNADYISIHRLVQEVVRKNHAKTGFTKKHNWLCLCIQMMRDETGYT